MNQQVYANHRRYVPMFHGVLFGLILLSLIGSTVNLIKSWGVPYAFYSASLLFVIMLCLLMLFFFCRSFALKAQDRAIRAEENLRHFVMTGRPLDPRLTIRQIIGLRFASDEEFLELAGRAVAQNMGEEEIKKAVRSWRGDYYRV
jgi:hypothetical protein